MWRAVWVGSALLCSCHASVPRDAPPAPENEDSLIAVAEVLNDAGTSDTDADVTAATLAEAADRSGEEDGGAPGSRAPLQLSARAFFGPRRDMTARASAGGATAATRRIDDDAVAYAQWQGAGFVRRVHVGRLKARLGEQLLLGRGFGAYTTAYSASAAGRLGWSPSLARTLGADAVALALGARRWTLRVIAARAVQGSSTVWLGVGREGPDSRVGATYGFAPGRAGVAVTSLHALRRVAGAAVSGEVVLDRERWFATARLETGAGRVTIFEAPVLTSTDAPLVDLRLRPGALRGGAVEWRRTPALPVAGRILLTEKVQPDLRQRRRQLWLSARVRARGAWSGEASFYYTSRIDETPPRDAAAETTQVRHYDQTRYRLALDIHDGRALHRIRVDYLPGGGDGIVVNVGSRIAAGIIEAEWRVTAYALPSGRQGFIARPGPGPFELFTAVYGRGSDASIRVRARVAQRIVLVGYYGRPYLKVRRLYLGAELALPKR